MPSVILKSRRTQYQYIRRLNKNLKNVRGPKFTAQFNMEVCVTITQDMNSVLSDQLPLIISNFQSRCSRKRK